MQVQHIDTTAQLNELETEWLALPLPSPMQSPNWLATWWETYGGGNRQLSTLALRFDGQLVGLAPLYIDTTDQTLRWLGDGRVCSDHQTLIVDPNHVETSTTAVAEWLLQSDAAHWRQLRLEAVNHNDAALRQLIDKLEAAGCPLSQREEPGSCYIDLPATWDEYLASVSKNHRKRTRRAYKESFVSGRARVDVYRSAEECLSAFDTLVRLHNDRRTALGEAGAFEDAQFLHFHRLAVQRLANANAVQLTLLSVDDEPVAAEYVLENNDTQFAYQGGLSAAGEAISAGNLSMLWQLKNAIERGQQRLDLLRGLEKYKFSWGAKHCPATTYLVRRPSRTAHVAAMCDNAWGKAKRLKRKLLTTS